MNFDELSASPMLADQSCKECRRRKAKCCRTIPTCGLCAKYRRHCLYEKHSRTPLTRRHLTEVEERLERAEALVRQMRALLPENLRLGASASVGGQDDSAPDPAAEAAGHDGLEYHIAVPDVSLSEPRIAPGTKSSGKQPAIVLSPTAVPVSAHQAKANNVPGHLQQPLERPHPLDRDSGEPSNRMQYHVNNPLESPPTTEDFEWDEQETMSVYGSPAHPGGEMDEGATPVLDGMASLSVDEKEAGYLGVASGAALLRLLGPQRRSRRGSAQARPPTGSSRLPGPYMPYTGYAFSFNFASQPNPNKHVVDGMIDAYFLQYHLSYPIVHEPTFRAQYAEAIPRPNGDSWLVLAYVVVAIGVFSMATASSNSLDLALFSQAKGILNFNFLEMGNLSLVQALALASNYQQKRDKPNAGYNYLGLATRMAMGLGLHKEFHGWKISPLNMEIRRRVWWTLCVFDVGATITFSRPQVWPYGGVEVALPLNVHDEDLTAASMSCPPETNSITPYTAVRTQASFHLTTIKIYDRVISKPFPSASELLELEKRYLAPWIESLPPYFQQVVDVSQLSAKYALAHAVMSWRIKNLRIIMYRPFVIRREFRDRTRRRREQQYRHELGDSGSMPGHQAEERAPGSSSSTSSPGKTDSSGSDNKQSAEDLDAQKIAYYRCLSDARDTIESVSTYWACHEHSRLAGWYGLYFLFQAALLPCVLLRNAPLAPQAADWRQQITTTLQTIAALAEVNPSASRSHKVISDLCGRYLGPHAAGNTARRTAEDDTLHLHGQEQRKREPRQMPMEQHERNASTSGHQVRVSRPHGSGLQHQQQRAFGHGGPEVHGVVAASATAPSMSMYPGPGMTVGPPAEGSSGGFDVSVTDMMAPVGDNAHVHINNVYSMMWPNAQPLEAADLAMSDDAWMEFLGSSVMHDSRP